MAESVRGQFVWHELMSSNPKAAIAFYKDLVGWKPRPWENPNHDYTMMTMAGGRKAGIMELPDPTAPTHWMCYIGTPNVDATARQTTELGGKVLKPVSDIPDVGRFAILQDPQGAIFVGFTPAPTEHMPANTKIAVGDFSWHELITTNWQAAFDFYQKLFGWEKLDSMEMGPGNVYQMFGWKGKAMLGGMFNKSPQMPGPPMWLPYALVPDSKKVADMLPRLGGKVTHGPAEVPGGDWITQLTDPQGVMFAVHSKKQAAAATPAAKRKTAPAKRSKPARKAKAAAKAKRKPSKKVKPARKKTGRAKARRRS